MCRFAFAFFSSSACAREPGSRRRTTRLFGQELEKHDFRGQDLSGAKFDDAELYGSDFTSTSSKMPPSLAPTFRR